MKSLLIKLFIAVAIVGGAGIGTIAVISHNNNVKHAAMMRQEANATPKTQTTKADDTAATSAGEAMKHDTTNQTPAPEDAMKHDTTMEAGQ